MPKEKYGLRWPDETDPAEVERYMLKKGGKFTEANGKTYGNGLLFHFKEYWNYLWPNDSQTWWTDLILSNVIENTFTSLVGPASSWKSGTVARLALMDWSLFPECTSVIMSSTHMDGLKARIYGETTTLWRRASERYGEDGTHGDWFPGFPIDSKCVITEADVEEDKARDLRNSIVGVPCQTSSGQFVGMGKYAGRKNRRVWCIGDEFQFMQISILQAQDNLISNDDGSGILGGYYGPDHADPKERGLPRRSYRCIFIGNTNPSVRDNPLDIVSEPELGWGSMPEDNKTKVWKCKKLPQHPVKCVCVNLDGIDSPNSPYPIEKPRWPHLAGPHKISKYTEGSESYWSNGRGVFKFGLDAFKIITKEICEQFHAFDELVWDGSEATTKIGMLDASYGVVGGDRCAVGSLEFGKCLDGKVRILVHKYEIVPVTIKKNESPEDQIAFYCRRLMEQRGVPPENFFFDGRGSLAMAMARNWSPQVNSVEFGGVPTDRPAGPDLWLVDEKTQQRRLQTARERFSKFISEMWWSARYVIESDQMRGLTMDVVLDAQPREWYKVAKDKIEIEPKHELKKRTGVSPDLADMLVTGVEGARRRGFQISKLAAPVRKKPGANWLDKERSEYEAMHESKQLKQ